ncbi:MAG: glycosyltransferase family 2 protein [Chitinophaga sp.]|uniref:glycosyltransferase family 2 protein n=1 Tax=Chitinophaga sp. TaxID=1869181 RepID=UPI0025BBF052|nr:glycosyltransferase family 2 protein [Chitinophaga sp.]MBV8254349.1 glycosyltransferase family 2 protein [Chitinophaga sp.]
MIESVYAIVILYNPQIEQVLKGLSSTLEQVDKVILVDNSPVSQENAILSVLTTKDTSKICYLFNNANLGVAEGQNIGIKKALAFGADFVLILDQDSIPEPMMVKNLMKDYQLLIHLNENVGVIGPVSINKQNNQPYKPRVKKFTAYEGAPHIWKVTELISSGSLISKTTFEKVGLMDERLFIDAVDHEWCWRAIRYGFSCAQTTSASLGHMLGEGDRKILGISIAITSPFRVFYQYRNYCYLVKESYVPLYWKINNAVKFSIKLIYYPLFVAPRMQYLRNMVKGIKAGMKGWGDK